MIADLAALDVGLGPALVSREGVHELLKRHRRDHGRVAQGLQLHVAAVVRALQLYDDEVGVGVDAQEIYPPRLSTSPQLLRRRPSDARRSRRSAHEEASGCLCVHDAFGTKAGFRERRQLSR